ncbi:MAG: putative Ig domain-containing protein, partial [Melioribacteraceae bacterium]
MKNFISLLLTFALSSYSATAQKNTTLNLAESWKFIAADKNEFSKIDYNYMGWGEIRIDRNWENQGHENYDGYAWYRIRVLIPSSLKRDAILKDSLKIFLGKIDDYDQSFINGKIFGINGRNVEEGSPIDDSFMKEQPIPWNKNRNYTLSCGDPRIYWDKENEIAVRVYDQGGAGGMFSGGAFIKMIELGDYLKHDFGRVQFELKKGKLSKSISLKNVSSLYPIEGKFIIRAEEKIDGKVFYEKKYTLNLRPETSQNFSYSFANRNRPTVVKYLFEYTKGGTESVFTDEAPYVLTPPESSLPKINGAKVYGQRPKMPFLYTIAATGIRPMTFEASNLPPGLELDKKTGIITGSVSETGIYKVKLSARNKIGSAEGEIKIIIGDKIALTPPMGWNSWNVWGLAIDQNKVIASAKVYKEKGLMNHGWTYINIDDGWEIPGNSSDRKRDANGDIICNSKFPDMKALGDSIHSLGLKFGIYSSPGPLTCGGYTGSYQYEINDARAYASWGIDYLKYDWCSYDEIAENHSLTELKKPYYIMRDALNNVNRDIVFSLCQYGMGNVWEWGGSVGGELWRTTGDITDTWQSMSEIGFGQIENAKYARPG